MVPLRVRCDFDPLITREINVLRGLLGFEKYLSRPTNVMCRDIVHTVSRHFLCSGALMCRVIVPLFLVMCQDIVPFCRLRKGYHETLFLPCGCGALRGYSVSLLLLLVAAGCRKSPLSLRHDVS